MPLVDLAPPDPFRPVGQAPLGPYQPPAEGPAPSIEATVAAAARQVNVIGSFMANRTMGVDNNPEDGFNPWDAIKGDERYERYWELFARANNPRYAAALKLQIDMEEQDRRTLDAAGIPGVIAGLAAGILDPTILLPGGQIVKGGRLGYSVSRSALSVGAAAGAGVAVQEAFLQGSQELRTAGESAFAVGGGVVLGALLGAGAARLLSPAERARSLEALDRIAVGGERSAGGRPPQEASQKHTFRGEIDLRHGAQQAPGDPDMTGFSVDFQGPRYDDDGGVFGGRGVYLDETGKWTGGGVDNRFTAQRVYGATARFERAFILTPESAPDLVALTGKGRSGQEIVEVLRAEGYDGLIVRGFDEKVRAIWGKPYEEMRDPSVPSGVRDRRGWEEQQFFSKLGLPPDVGDDQVFAFLPQNVRINGVVAPSDFAAAVRPASGEPFRMSEAERQGLSAQAVADSAPTREDMSIDGTVAGALAKATSFVSPQLRILQNPSAVARSVFLELAESTIPLRMNREGRTVGQAAETLARQEFEGRFADALSESNSIYKEMKKSGLNMRIDDFELAVGRAMRRGDRGENEFVSRAAASWREKLFDPFKERAISPEIGLLPEDVSVETAASYFSRVYNRERIIAQEGEFLRRATEWLSGRMSATYGENKEALLRRWGSIDQQIADLRATPEERIRAGIDIMEQTAKLEADNKEVREALGDIEILRNAAKADPALAAQNKQEIERLRATYGERLNAYVAARRELRRRERSLQMGYSAMAQKTERTLQIIEDLEEANRRSMDTLIRKGAQLQRERQRLAPEKLEQKIAGMRDQFDAVSRSADRAATRAEQTLANFERDLERVRERAGRDAEKGINRSAELADAEDAFAARTRALLEREAKYQRARADRLAEINTRIEAAERVDLSAQMDEVMAGVNKLVEDVGERALRRGAKRERLQTRLADFDPKRVDDRITTLEKLRRDSERRFLDRWETDNLVTGIRLDGPDTPNFSEAAKDAAQQVVNKIVGRDAQAGILPEWATPVTRGPMKDRTFLIPDELIEDFLESNIRQVAERYGRQMSGEIYLTQKFGRADMADQLGTPGNPGSIQRDFERMRGLVNDAPNADAAMKVVGREPGIMDGFREWMKGENYTQATKERLLKYLDQSERSALSDLAALRDLARGTYQAAANASDFGRISRAVNNFNYIRQMGGAALSSLSEFYRPAMVHGLVPYFRDAIVPLITNLDAIKMATKEARAAGLIGERVTLHRLTTVGELGDPYAKASGFERVLQQGSVVASRWNFLPLITDMQQAISSVSSQNRLLGILDNMAVGKAASAKDTTLVAFLGIDAPMAERIGNLFRQHGETLDGVKIANTEKWNDRVAVEAYRAAINKDVHSIITRPGNADLPLFARTPLGRMMLQFRSFSIAAHQRVMLRGLQEDQARFVGGMIAFASMGMFVAYLKSIRQGEEARQRFVENTKNNPMFLVGEGIDNANPFPLLMDFSNTVERVSRATTPGGFNPIKTPIRALGGSTQQSSVRGNYVDVWGALAGPTAGLGSDIARAAGLAGSLGSGEAPSEGQTNAAMRLLPFNSYIGAREMLQAIHGDSPYLRTR